MILQTVGKGQNRRCFANDFLPETATATCLTRRKTPRKIHGFAPNIKPLPFKLCCLPNGVPTETLHLRQKQFGRSKKTKTFWNGCCPTNWIAQS